MSAEKFEQLIRAGLTSPFDETDIGRSLFRTCLECIHAHYMTAHPLVSPSLELGVGDGSSSMFINGRDGGEVTVGLDMPIGMTYETRGLWWHQAATHYRGFVGATMENIPFADATFESVYTSETMFYGMDLKATAREIARVLKPGGRFLCFNASDAWNAFNSFRSQLEKVIPTFAVPDDDTFVSIFERAGLDCSERSYFFSPAMEILSQAVFDSGAGQNSEYGLHTQSPESLAQKIPILAELLAHEIDLKTQGFHYFLVFNKTDNVNNETTRNEKAGGFDPFGHLRCPNCGALEFNFSPSSLTCNACTSSYTVVCGVPIMIDPKHEGYSTLDLDSSIANAITSHLTSAQKASDAVFERYAKRLRLMMAESEQQAMDLIVMADSAFESRTPICRQVALALRYRLKCEVPTATFTIRFCSDQEEKAALLPDDDTPVFALYLTDGKPIPDSLQRLTAKRKTNAVRRAVLDFIK